MYSVRKPGVLASLAGLCVKGELLAGGASGAAVLV